MAGEDIFTHTAPDLLALLDVLRLREPIFHTPGFARTHAEQELAVAPDYWEVGASGRRYSRAFILDHLYREPAEDDAALGWQSLGHALRRLGPDTYLMTYTLRQRERLTRRATIWQAERDTWRILYHQGTLVSAEEDDTFPT